MRLFKGAANISTLTCEFEMDCARPGEQVAAAGGRDTRPWSSQTGSHRTTHFLFIKMLSDP